MVDEVIYKHIGLGNQTKRCYNLLWTEAMMTIQPQGLSRMKVLVTLAQGMRVSLQVSVEVVGVHSLCP